METPVASVPSLTPDALHLERSGPEGAPRLLLLHGWGSNAANMRPVAKALESDYHVFNVDLPGHGMSPVPPTPWGIPEHAALVRWLLDDIVGTPVTILGHSNGGRIALHMASDPELKRGIERLVLVSPSGIRPTRGAGYYARRAVARTLKAPFQLLPPPLREFGLDWLRHSLVWKALGSSDYRNLHGVMRETFVKTVNFFVEDRIDRIDIPVLLFWGDRDTAISREQMRVLETKIPDSGLVVLANAGHYGYLDDYDTFVAATRYFLENS